MGLPTALFLAKSSGIVGAAGILADGSRPITVAGPRPIRTAFPQKLRTCRMSRAVYAAEFKVSNSMRFRTQCFEFSGDSAGRFPANCQTFVTLRSVAFQWRSSIHQRPDNWTSVNCAV